MNRLALAAVLILPSLPLAIACDDDRVTPSDAGGMDPPDSGTADGGGAPADAGQVLDAGGCDESTCVHGACAGEECTCEPGWSGGGCDTLAEPADEGILLWFDADHDASFEGTGFDQIDSWTARVAVNGPVVTTPGAVDQRPRRLPEQLNGRATVTFDGVDDTLSSDGDGTVYWEGTDGVDSYTLVALFQASLDGQVALSVVSNAHALGMTVGTGGRGGQVEAKHGDAMAAGGVSPLQIVSAPDTILLTDFSLVVLRVSETGVTLRVDGEEVANVPLDDPIPLRIDEGIVNLGVDSIFFSDSRYLGGALAEVILFSGPLSPTVIGAVEDYLRAKWGL